MRAPSLLGLTALVVLSLSSIACGPGISHEPGSRTPPDPSTFTRQYGVEPGAGLQFTGNEWGYAITADGFGGFTLAMLGDPRYPSLQDRFFGSVYVESTTTVSDLGGTANQVAVTPQRIDYDLLLLGADQAEFTFKNNAGANSRVFLDLYVSGGHFGAWDIFFVSSDTGQPATSPDNPVALVSP